jgi:hypothetical protein
MKVWFDDDPAAWLQDGPKMAISGQLNHPLEQLI